jgi:hypothetical protein
MQGEPPGDDVWAVQTQPCDAGGDRSTRSRDGGHEQDPRARTHDAVLATIIGCCWRQQRGRTAASRRASASAANVRGLALPGRVTSDYSLLDELFDFGGLVVTG